MGATMTHHMGVVLEDNTTRWFSRHARLDFVDVFSILAVAGGHGSRYCAFIIDKMHIPKILTFGMFYVLCCPL